MHISIEMSSHFVMITQKANVTRDTILEQTQVSAGDVHTTKQNSPELTDNMKSHQGKWRHNARMQPEV